MAKQIIYTKQHENVLFELQTRGVYYARRAFIEADLEEHATLVLDAYDWYARQLAKRLPKPALAEYPVWVSYKKAAAMLPGPGTVVLQCEVDESLIVPVNIFKWGRILNYGYIPKDEEDKKRHGVLLEEYGTSDTQAYMSRFFPQIKAEIVGSWTRLFDEGISLGSKDCYGTLWQLRADWVLNATGPPGPAQSAEN